MGPLGTKNEVF